MINLSIISLFITLLIFLTLICAAIIPNNNNNLNSTININNYFYLNTMKFLSVLAVLNLIIYNFNPNNIFIYLLNWFPNIVNNNISIFLDFNFIFFSSTALIVTWSIIEFSIYYLSSDPFNSGFFRLLIIFLLNMLILTSANNLFLFFIGWEGVGFLSFLLIGWWSSRQNANNAALQAIIYNRIGDIGILIFIITILSLSNSWNMDSLITIWNNINNDWKNIILFFLLLAATGKSAQFGLHPWLPAAMEGPTPVSALLHSSTMVVAGVFILIRINTIIQPTQLFLNSCLILGSLTSIFAATTAIVQHDIKKIIAYSTTSQLGLMIIAIGLNQPLLALFHICTHAFFKAMLFLSSGSIIHSYNNEQDLRKIQNISNNLPITSACITLGSLALMGTPFLSGFYSKDLILENIILSPINILSLILIFIAVLLTIVYSSRIFLFCFLNQSNSLSVTPINEENNNLLNPLLRLSIGSIITGWILINYSIENNFLFPIPIIKFLPLLLLIITFLFSNQILNNTNNKSVHPFFSLAWYFSPIIHFYFEHYFNNLALLTSNRILDRGWIENISINTLTTTSTNLTKNNQIIQSGYIKQYLLIIFIFIIIITITLLLI
uniref:NADH-ubiquinone oxidoreductase chain 5 n=1 Tax=Peniagone sp. YYH-2013 TaxID=1430316 RepID=W5VY96_9ECHN|nr:NADH dehydrogenase subunit 5 [Peniagone sp. YYH-2013]